MKRLIAVATLLLVSSPVFFLSAGSLAQEDNDESLATPGPNAEEPVFVEPPPPEVTSDPNFEPPSEAGQPPMGGPNAPNAQIPPSAPARFPTPAQAARRAPPANKAATNGTKKSSSAAKTDRDSQRIESFDFQNAEIEEVVRAISQLTGKNFILDPNVKGKISVIAPSAVTIGEAYRAFLSALAINGYTVVPSGKFLKIMPARVAQRDSIEIYTKGVPNSDQMVTRIVSLKFISVQDVSRFLRSLSSKDGDMIGYEPTNSLIISDYGANIRRILKIIDELDQAGFEEKMTVIPVRYAKAKDLADLIDKIINKNGQGARNGGFRPGNFPVRQPASAGASGGASEALSLVAPDDRTNSLIVVGNQEGIDKVKMLVEELDFNLDPSESGGVFVYRLRHSTAENIANTLNGLVKAGAAPSPASAAPSASRPFTPQGAGALFGGDVKITPDKNTNSIIVVAGKQDYDVVKQLISKIDIPRDQVYVEAIIMEINSTKTRDWSVTNYYLDPSSKGIGRAGYSGGNLSSLLDPLSDAGVVLGFGHGQKFDIKFGNNTFTIPSLLSFVKFLQTHTDANILSTPQILAMDNEEAMIEVGDQVPIGIQRQTTTGGVITESPQFEKATIKLTITPNISPESGTIRLAVNQSVRQPSQATLPSALQNIATVISDRSIKTNIVVENEDTVVLGGLIRDEESHIVNKVPLLGDIPVIGWLFKSDRVQTDKINLVVFLTPKIIRNQSDSRRLLGQKMEERLKWLQRNTVGEDPHAEKFESLRRPEVPPPQQQDPNMAPPQPAPKQGPTVQQQPAPAVPEAPGMPVTNPDEADRAPASTSEEGLVPEETQGTPAEEPATTEGEESSSPQPAPTPAPAPQQPQSSQVLERRQRFG